MMPQQPRDRSAPGHFSTCLVPSFKPFPTLPNTNVSYRVCPKQHRCQLLVFPSMAMLGTQWCCSWGLVAWAVGTASTQFCQASVHNRWKFICHFCGQMELNVPWHFATVSSLLGICAWTCACVLSSDQLGNLVASVIFGRSQRQFPKTPIFPKFLENRVARGASQLNET